MRKDLLIIALGLFVAAGAAVADVLSVPETAPAQPSITLPAKGTSMADVERKFGSPRERQPTVGGGSPKQPPITRWDYADFLVIFEHDKVVDAVIPGAPPRIYNKDELQPVAEAPPMPGAAAPLGPAEPAPDAPMEPESATPAEPEAPAADAGASEPAPEATPENPYPDRPPAE